MPSRPIHRQLSVLYKGSGRTPTGSVARRAGFTAGDVLAFACLPGISTPVQTLFDGAPDTTL
ncbi:MAG: hypothetical protein L6Q98_01475 [Anaerolineae bacterium]|nr:hypothetical protein [Anaerolineae bacterium]NUQ04440.1 hypothetical protein [Anaerolineae bacterium]